MFFESRQDEKSEVVSGRNPNLQGNNPPSNIDVGHFHKGKDYKIGRGRGRKNNQGNLEGRTGDGGRTGGGRRREEGGRRRGRTIHGQGVGRKSFDKKRNNENKDLAVAKIQALFRGKQVRDNIKIAESDRKVKIKENKAASKIQTWFRRKKSGAHNVINSLKNPYLNATAQEECAAFKLQMIFRKNQERKQHARRSKLDRERQFKAMMYLHKNKNVQGFGRFLEISWNNHNALEDLLFIIQIKTIKGLRKQVTTKGTITNIKELQVLDYKSHLTFRIGITPTKDILPVFDEWHDYITDIPCPRVKDSSTSFILLDWSTHVPKYIFMNFIFIIECYNTKNYSWKSVYQGHAFECQVYNLQSNTAYRFRLVIQQVYVKQCQDDPMKVGITFNDVPKHFELNSNNRFTWTSNEVIGITSMDTIESGGMGPFWYLKWTSPIALPRTILIYYQVDLYDINTPDEIIKSYTIKETSLELDDLKQSKTYGFNVISIYKGKKDKEDYHKQIRIISRFSKRIYTLMNCPNAISVTATEALLTWDTIPEIAKTYIACILQYQRLEHDTWTSIKETMDLKEPQYEFAMSISDSVYSIRLAVAKKTKLQEDINNIKDGYFSSSYVVLSPISLRVHGLGKLVKIDWYRPNIPGVEFEIMQQSFEGDTIIYNCGNECFFFPNQLKSDQRYYFGVVAILGQYKSFPRMIVYSTMIPFSFQIDQVLSHSCNLSLSTKVLIENYLSLEFKIYEKQEKEWIERYQGCERKWEFKDLDSHTFIQMKLYVCISLGTYNHHKEWEELNIIKFLTACDPPIPSIGVQKGILLNWKAPSPAYEDEIATDNDFFNVAIEMYDSNRSQYVTKYQGISCSFELTTDIEKNHFYSFRIRSNWHGGSFKESVYSEEIIALSECDNPIAKSISETSFEIQWSPTKEDNLIESHKEMLSKNYIVEVSKGSYGKDDKKGKKIKENPYTAVYSHKTRTHFIYRELDPFTTYHARIRHCFGFLSMVTNTVSILTENSVPLAPILKAEELFVPKECAYSGLPTSFISIQWIKPKGNGHPIIGYALEMAIGPVNRVSRPSKADWIGIYVGTSNSYRIDMETLKTKGEGRYFFRLQAANELGYSEYTNIAYVDYMDIQYRKETIVKLDEDKEDNKLNIDGEPKKGDHESATAENSTACKSIISVDNTSSIAAINTTHQEKFQVELWKKSKIKYFLPQIPRLQQTVCQSYLKSRNLEVSKEICDIQRKPYIKKRPKLKPVEKSYAYATQNYGDLW